MIPKVIHYCWYGNAELPPMYRKCIETWGRHLAGYEIKLWNESNTDFDNDYLKDKFKRKEWAFISDYVRLRAIHEHGGIYLDADIEVIKPLDSLLHHDCFLGYEAANRLTTGVIGSIPSHPFPLRCMQIIERRHAVGKPYLIAPEVATLAFEEAPPGESIFDCPIEYFYPYNPYDPQRLVNNLMFCDIMQDTYCIHHWGKSWKQSLLTRLIKKLRS